MKDNTAYMPEIDGLRAIAVLLVIGYHLDITGLFSAGFIGVDVFFVISGFLITGVIVKEIESTGNFSFYKFFMRRLHRLYPALMVTIILTFSFGFLVMDPDAFGRLAASALYASVFLSNMYFWQQADYFDVASDTKPLLHTWSLGIEEQFYLLWPLVIFASYRYLGKISVVPIILFLSALSLLLNLIYYDGAIDILEALNWQFDGQSAIFYLLPFRVFEFGIGAFFCLASVEKRLSAVVTELVFCVGLLLIVGTSVSLTPGDIFPSFNAVWPCFGAAFVILGRGGRVARFLLANRFAVSIGLISYSLYLVHWPVIVFYKYLTLEELSWVARTVLAAMVVLMAYLMYVFVETKFRHLHSDSSTSMQATRLAGAVIVPLFIALSANAWAKAGWEWRLPEIPEGIQNQISQPGEFHKTNYGGQGYPYKGLIVDAGKTGPDIVLLGDSHARHYAYGLDSNFRDSPLQVSISSVSCLTLPGIIRNTPGQDWTRLCGDALELALNQLAVNPGSILVVSFSWTSQQQRAINKSTGESVTNEQLIEGLDRLYSSIGKRALVVIGEVPGAGSGDPLACYARPRFLPIHCPGASGTQLSGSQAEKMNEVLMAFADRHADVLFLDPAQELCKGDWCPAVLDDKLIYSDKYHLSKHGSVTFISGIAGRLHDLLKAKMS